MVHLLLVTLALVPARGPSVGSLSRAQQRVGDALDAASDAALFPALVRADEPEQQDPPAASIASRPRRQPTGAYPRDMLTRPAPRPKPSVAERLEAMTDTTLQPALREEPKQPEASVRSSPRSQTSGPERAARYLERKYDEFFGAAAPGS